MKTVILIPCYNESKTMEKVVKDYKKALTFKDYEMLQSSSIRKGTGIIDSVAYKGYIVRSLQDPNTCYYFDRTEKLIEEFNSMKI